MKKTAIVTGITGQDGAYLAQYLLSLGYDVHGTFRRTSSTNFWRLEYLGIENDENLTLHETDLQDLGSLVALMQRVKPQEVYNLAAQSFVGVSFDQPYLTAQITALGALNVLEAIRLVDRNIRFYQASTSELYGKVQEIPQKETTPFYPRSPYGVAKLYAHWITKNYQESYGIFGCSGILFNHESPLRGKEFVTRKITDAVARIKVVGGHVLKLGNIDSLRDWGYAKDYVVGMHAMLQASEPDTYVLATNKKYSVRDFVNLSFEAAGIAVQWEGSGEHEIAKRVDTGEVVVRIDPAFYRPAEVDLLIGDYSKAREKLGWEPKLNLEGLCELMVQEDIKRYM